MVQERERHVLPLIARDSVSVNETESISEAFADVKVVQSGIVCRPEALLKVKS